MTKQINFQYHKLARKEVFLVLVYLPQYVIVAGWILAGLIINKGCKKCFLALPTSVQECDSLTIAIAAFFVI